MLVMCIFSHHMFLGHASPLLVKHEHDTMVWTVGKVKAFNGKGFDDVHPPSAPSSAHVDASAPPAESLRIEHVHGYNKSTVAYSAKGDAVFGAASVCVVQKDARQSVVFASHSDDVSCMALNDTGELAATGASICLVVHLSICPSAHLAICPFARLYASQSEHTCRLYMCMSNVPLLHG